MKKAIDPNELSFFFPLYSFRKKKKIIRLVIMFPGAGCSFHKETGGCSMCGFHLATNEYSGGCLAEVSVLKELLLCGLAKIQSYKDVEVIFFNGGSFWNNLEIPESFQYEAMSIITKYEAVTDIIVENRCEYISQEKLINSTVLLKEKELSVVIGLESSDDYIRNVLIGKSLDKQQFENSMMLIKKCGAHPLVYIFLKPLGLSEKDAVLDTLKSVQYALSVGAEEIFLSSAFVQEDTLMAKEYLAGNFKPPWLYSVLEIIKHSIQMSWPLRLGVFDDEPSPIAAPSNCPICSDKINQILDGYRQCGYLENIPDCHCFNDWLESMS